MLIGVVSSVREGELAYVEAINNTKISETILKKVSKHTLGLILGIVAVAISVLLLVPLVKEKALAGQSGYSKASRNIYKCLTILNNCSNNGNSFKAGI